MPKGHPQRKPFFQRDRDGDWFLLGGVGLYFFVLVQGIRMDGVTLRQFTAPVLYFALVFPILIVGYWLFRYVLFKDEEGPEPHRRRRR